MKEEKTMVDVYSIGEMVIDFIPGSEEASYIRKAGGAPANVAIAVAKNDLSASMCCKVGEDDFGRFLMKTLEEYKVKAACPKLCEEAITTMAFVSLAEDGERVFTFARKPGADMFLTEEDVKEEDIENSAIIHAGSCSLSAQPVASATVKAMRVAHEKGKLVSFDVNYRNLMWKDDQKACTQAVMAILKYVDLLKISEEEVEMMGGEAALPELMKKEGITLLIETLGSEGAQAFFGGEVIRIAGRRVKAVDATGAGDAFWGGFLSSLRIQGVNTAADLTADIIRTAMEYGNVSGCICVQSKGAIVSIPTRAQIEEYLKENL
ncbi:MAG: carbohydrate kinase [Lachnospiraceae bacterium]|nr:carbohydrate kinase [Lachnospiraceae bacterium]